MTIAPRAAFSGSEAAAYAAMALACVHRPYPFQVAHELDGDGAVATPRQAHPAFWGCYDWHSAVHGHWAIAAVLRRFPDSPVSGQCAQALDRSLTAAALTGEEAYLRAHPAFERPYGLAWLCALHGELAALPADAAWADRLAPAAELAARRIAGWLERLSHPTRVGTHGQSAFAAALVLDAAATSAPAAAVADRVRASAHRLHDHDRGPALHLEPSGEDFLSPALGAAALMARVAAPADLAAWLRRALPELTDDDRGPPPIVPACPVDRTDGRLVHLDGLNASRATALAIIARALPADDARRGSIDGLADAHAAAALAALADQGYAGGHWLGTFALAMRLALA